MAILTLSTTIPSPRMSLTLLIYLIAQGLFSTHGFNTCEWKRTGHDHTHRCSNIITSHVIPTKLLTDHHAVECEFRYGKPARQTHRMQYRKYSSIDLKAFTEDVRSMFATNLKKNLLIVSLPTRMRSRMPSINMRPL